MNTTQSPCVGPLDLQMSCLCDSASTSPALPGHEITIKQVQDQYLQNRNNCAFNKVENSGPVSAAFIISDNCKPFVLEPGRIDYSSSKKRLQQEQPHHESKPLKVFKVEIKPPQVQEVPKKRVWHSSMVDEIAAAGNFVIEGLQDDSTALSPDVGNVSAPKYHHQGPVTRSQVSFTSSRGGSIRATPSPAVQVGPQPAFTSSPDLAAGDADWEEGLSYLKRALQHSEQVLDATKRNGPGNNKYSVTGHLVDQPRPPLNKGHVVDPPRPPLNKKAVNFNHVDPPRAPLGNVMNRVNTVNSVNMGNSFYSQDRKAPERKAAPEKTCHAEMPHQIAGLQDFGGELVADASRASFSESGPAPSGAKPRTHPPPAALPSASKQALTFAVANREKEGVAAEHGAGEHEPEQAALRA